MKLFLYSILFFTLFSCATAEKKMSKILVNIEMGMTLDEFIKVSKTTEQVSISGDYRVYRIGTKDLAKGYDSRMFYFHKNILYQMNEGERPINYQLKID